MNNKTSINLNKNQLLAVQMLATGRSGKDVANELGVTAETVSRWRQEPDFRQQLDDILFASQKIASQRLAALMIKSLEVLEDSFCDLRMKSKDKCTVALKILALCQIKENLPATNVSEDVKRVRELIDQYVTENQEKY